MYQNVNFEIHGCIHLAIGILSIRMLQLGVVFQYKLITVISVLTDNDRVELFVSAKSKHVDISCHFCIFSGRGNSAFETATHIYGATNLIHMVARSRVRLSWATHYVGDLR